jgi:hypothetical protein
MDNVNAEVKGTQLVVTVDLTKDFGASSSGKTNIVASSRGGVALAGNQGFCLNISVYKPAAAKKV